MPMNCAHLETASHQNVRLVPVEPHVKSAETRDLFNAGAGTPAQIGKSADPSCYNSLTVDQDRRRTNMKSSGWVVVVFENEQKQFAGECAYVKGPFDLYEEAQDWAEGADDCNDGEFQITFIEPKS